MVIFKMIDLRQKRKKELRLECSMFCTYDTTVAPDPKSCYLSLVSVPKFMVIASSCISLLWSFSPSLSLSSLVWESLLMSRWFLFLSEVILYQAQVGKNVACLLDQVPSSWALSSDSYVSKNCTQEISCICNIL